jgi:hypothetical protein
MRTTMQALHNRSLTLLEWEVWEKARLDDQPGEKAAS